MDSKRLERQALESEGLSDKALKVFSSSDTLNIYKHSNGTFSIKGLILRDDMTLQELNDTLENFEEEE